MTNATSLTARWYDTPRTVKPLDPDEPVWKVEGVTIRLGKDNTLELSAPRYGGEKLRVDVSDGELRFPLEDLVPLVLDRLDITELARMICGNQEGRREILDALARRYNECGVEDEDRRHWIAKVQAEVHDKKLDELASAMTTIERAVGQMGYRAMDRFDHGNVLRHELERAGVDDEAAIAAAERYAQPSELVDFRRFVEEIGIGEGAWAEARDFWREQVKALFKNVAVPAVPTSDIAA